MAAGGAAVRAASAEQDNVSRPITTGTGFCVDVRPSRGSSWVSLRSRRYANAVVVVASKFKHGISIDDVKQAIILRCATAVYTVRVYASGESRVAAASIWLGGRGGRGGWCKDIHFHHTLSATYRAISVAHRCVHVFSNVSRVVPFALRCIV